jgi:diguanylate cyclase (GGDEF)-like protein/PAS domain S-box-containing protein
MTKDNADLPPAERRRKLRRSDDFLNPNFQDMIEGAVQGILVHSNFRPLYANPSFAKIFGYAGPEEITAMPLIRPLFPKEIWPDIEQHYHDLMRGERLSPIGRIKAVRRDGKEIWLSCTNRVIEWGTGKAIQICIFDISQQVAMEHLMLGNEQQLRAILEILPVPVFIARRRDGRILFVNRKTCLLLQQSAGPLLRAHSPDFFVEQEDRKKIHMMVDAVHDVREVEVRMKTAQGREFIAELAAINVDYATEPAMLVSINDISERKKLEAELFHQANTDSLTGLSNRRFFMIQAEQEIRRARRFNRSLSIIMMDLDYFKHINDTYGHAAGDSALETIVRASLESLRESDVMGRLGGEEFAVILPETNIQAASDVANRLLEHIAETPVATSKGVVQCTASLGVAQLSSKDNTIDDLLCRADEALFLAKEHGRNRIEIAKK